MGEGMGQDGLQVRCEGYSKEVSGKEAFERVWGRIWSIVPNMMDIGTVCQNIWEIHGFLYMPIQTMAISGASLRPEGNYPRVGK